jgi:Protein of unknown function (DUF3592)
MMNLKWMIIGAGLVMGFFIIGVTLRRYRQLTQWACATGKVVSQWRYHNKYAPVIEFQDADGRTRQFKERYIRKINQDWDLQAEVPVRYNAHDSTQAILDFPSPYLGIGIGGLIVCFVFVYTGLFLL